MNKEERVKNNKFKRFLKIYSIGLILIIIVAIIYVGCTLIEYEKNQINNFIEDVITDLKKYANKNEMGKHINSINVSKGEFEISDASVEEGLNELLKSDENVRFEINPNSKNEIKPIYDIYVNDYKIFEVGLDGSNVKTKLSLLTFSKWKILYINVEAEKGLLKFEISALNNCEVYVNNKKLTEKEIVTSNSDNGLLEISKYVEIPYLIKYEINGLIKKPNYRIVDKNGNVVNEQDIKINDNVKRFETIDNVKKEIKNLPNIIKIAEDWSLFLSNDLSGSNHGFSNISKYLIKDSYLYNYSYKWATNVDIAFISNHTLKNPAFTNEKISNFVIYNDKAFSCDVYLDKNMRIANGNDLVDKMNEKMYFAYYDDTKDGVNNPSWKLANMQSITDDR